MASGLPVARLFPSGGVTRRAIFRTIGVEICTRRLWMVAESKINSEELVVVVTILCIMYGKLLFWIPDYFFFPEFHCCCPLF